MLSRFLGNSKPIVFLSLASYLSIHYWIDATATLNTSIFATIGKYLIILILFFGVNFIVKRNKINGTNAYAVFAFVMLITSIPSFYLDYSPLLAAFFVSLGLRRIISLKTQIDPKKKIFDASLWFFVASLFQPHLMLLMLVVFYAIIEYTLYDPKNFFIPLFAWLSGAFIFSAFHIINSDEWIYFYEKYQGFGWSNISLVWEVNRLFLSIYIIFSLFILIASSKILSKVALALKTSMLILIFTFLLISMGWFFTKQHDLSAIGVSLIPLSMLAGSVFQLKMKPVLKEALFAILIIFSFSSFFILV